MRTFSLMIALSAIALFMVNSGIQKSCGQDAPEAPNKEVPEAKAPEDPKKEAKKGDKKPKDDDKKAKEEAKKAAKKKAIEDIKALKIDKIDMVVLEVLVGKVYDLPLPTLGYQAFGIANKDGAPIKTQVRINGIEFNSDGQTALMGGNIVYAPEGSAGFGSNLKDLKVLWFGYNKDKNAYDTPTQVVGVPSVAFPKFTEYSHNSAYPGFMVIVK